MASERDDVSPAIIDSTLIEYRDGQMVRHHLHQDLCVHVAPSFYERTLT